MYLANHWAQGAMTHKALQEPIREDPAPSLKVLGPRTQPLTGDPALLDPARKRKSWYKIPSSCPRRSEGPFWFLTLAIHVHLGYYTGIHDLLDSDRVLLGEFC